MPLRQLRVVFQKAVHEALIFLVEIRFGIDKGLLGIRHDFWLEDALHRALPDAFFYRSFKPLTLPLSQDRPASRPPQPALSRRAGSTRGEASATSGRSSP